VRGHFSIFPRAGEGSCDDFQAANRLFCRGGLPRLRDRCEKRAISQGEEGGAVPGTVALTRTARGRITGLDFRTDTQYGLGMAARKPKKKNPAAVALSKLAAAARRKKISPERRSELASHAATARWAKVKQAEAGLKGGRPMK